MAFNLTSLTEYVDQSNKELLIKTITGAKTFGLLNLQTGVKYKTALNLLDNEVYFQDGESCAFTNSGDTAFSQRTITANIIKINKEWCDKDLRKYWTNYDVTMAATNKSLPFEQNLVDSTIAKAHSKIEKLIWQGDTNSANSDLARTDGFVKLIQVVTGSTLNVASSTAITSANAVAQFDAMVAKFPSELLMSTDQKVIFCGIDIFVIYAQALKNANMFNYTSEINNTLELVIPGTGIKVIGVPGLDGVRGVNGSPKMYGGVLSNFFVGTDLQSDVESIDMKYIDYTKTFRLTIEFSLGFQVAYPSQIVAYGMA